MSDPDRLLVVPDADGLPVDAHVDVPLLPRLALAGDCQVGRAAVLVEDGLEARMVSLGPYLWSVVVSADKRGVFTWEGDAGAETGAGTGLTNTGHIDIQQIAGHLNRS